MFRSDGFDVHRTRAYFHFASEAQASDFVSALRGRVFQDSAGADWTMVPEFALYQRLPGAEQRDRRENTITHDASYKEFVAMLEARSKAEVRACGRRRCCWRRGCR
jgi:hypothetical protein